jgi:GT2 family glycosyltransferase
MTDLSVIIVTWNNEEDIEGCLSSILESTNKFSGISAEIIIIDNSSSDKTLEKIGKFKQENFRVYENKENLGYTKPVNQGINYSKGKNILLLNPDTVIMKDSILRLADFLNNNGEYGACCPLLVNEDGSIQHSIRSFPSYWKMYCEFYLLAYIFPKSKIFGGWKMKYFDYLRDADVCQPMAAALMIKKPVIEKTGLMDEQFTMFFNDVDLCKRIIDAGLKIRFIKDSEIMHKKGTSVHKARIKMIKEWNKDCLKYFKKHHPNPLMILWLKINLKISEIIRILFYKIS